MGDPMKRRDLLKAGMAALSAPALPRLGFAQGAYPDRPVRLIVPFPPGGAFDTVGRPWADRIKPHLGAVVIENIGGAGGGLGAAQTARSRPDGYTLLLGGATTHITEALLKTKPTFDPLKDLEPISPIAVTAFAIAVHPSVSANNLKELVAYVKTHLARCPMAPPATARSTISPANCSSSRRASPTFLMCRIAAPVPG
jgi:tripartite-type tricarboxylate transporter receptor subunit TctC